MIRIEFEANTIDELRVKCCEALGMTLGAATVSKDAKVEAPQPAEEKPKKQTAAAKKAAEKKAEPDPEPEAEAEAPKEDAAEEVTKDMVRDEMYKYVRAFEATNKDDVDAARIAFKSLLDEFGVAKLSELPEHKFVDMIKLAQAKTAELG